MQPSCSCSAWACATARASVLQDVDLPLAAGSFHFLVGPSGAGKTSLLRLLSLTQPAIARQI